MKTYMTADELLDELMRRGATRLAGASDIADVRTNIQPFLETTTGWVIHEEGTNRWAAVELNSDGSESQRRVAFRGGPRERPIEFDRSPGPTRAWSNVDDEDEEE